MPAPLINWEKLIPYDTDQSRSFEELCYQIAKKQFEKDGQFTSIDDSGGGDGVEFYLTQPNGEQWGWQAKLYLPGDRLDEGGRKAAIKKSLRKACEEHPKLKKFLLCTPKNLTPDEQNWYSKDLASSTLDGSPVVPSTSTVTLERWGESDFIAWMSEERFAGIRDFFFGELELTLEWFKRQFEKQTAGIKDKFSHSLHTPTRADALIHRVLADDQFAIEAKGILAKLNQCFLTYQEACQNLRGNKPLRIKWGDSKNALIAAVKETEQHLQRILAAFHKATDLLTQRRLDLLRTNDWQALRGLIQDAAIRLAGQFNGIDVESLPCDGDSAEQRETHYEATQILERPSIKLNEYWEQTEQMLDGFMAAEVSELHLLGDAGAGKTQLAAEICHERLERGFPALFISGKHFNGDGPIEQQLRAILDIATAYSWNDFLRSLDVAATAYGTRIPIFIDGLNEAVRNGLISDVWRLGLAGFRKEFRSINNVVLLTSCRGSYERSIWTGGDVPRFMHVQGFDDDNIEEAVQKYFTEYKIEAELTAESLDHFRHPLYLKLFCETKNPERKQTKRTFVGKAGLFEVFSEFLKQCNNTVGQRLGLHPSVDVLNPALFKLAEVLWSERKRSIDVIRAVQLIDGKPLHELNWEQSRTKAVENEGLLVSRDWMDLSEHLSFTYDLLAGYIIAKHLLDANASRLPAFLLDPEVEEKLFAQNPEKLHPLHADIARCIAALLPIQSGLYLHRLSNNKAAFSYSINALFELGPEHVDQECAEEVLDLFKRPQSRTLLFRNIRTVLTVHSHPLGAQFLHTVLQSLSIKERDLSWTEYVRKQTHELENFVSRISGVCARKTVISESEGASLHLAARYMMWMLTSTVRPFRDRVTKALYHFGRRYPEQLFELLCESLAINDIYIPERMIAAAYGVCMAGQNDFAAPDLTTKVLPAWARWLYDNVFAVDAKYSTTHVLMRDYARRICEIALLHSANLLNTAETQRLRPPYKDGGLRTWSELTPEAEDVALKEGSPFRMDFENYSLGGLVTGRANYDFKHKGYVKERACILWRILELGWNAKDFGDIDQEIARTQNFGRVGVGGAQTDRYGKKYSWIAYFERLGFLRDGGFEKDSFDADRPADADLDPSFPNPTTEAQIITSDLLGDDEATTADWIAQGPTPNLQPWFVLPELHGDSGPWLLLDGYVAQECQKRGRRVFAFVRTLVVHANDYTEFMRGLIRQHLGGRWLPEKPVCYYAFAGEFPWSDTWHVNGWSKIEFEVHGARKKFDVLIPVHEYAWEGYHSVLNKDVHATLLAKEIALETNLVGQPQTQDLFDSAGRRGTIAVGHGRRPDNSQSLLYIRKDILDSYLAKNGYRLAIAVWGEREYSTEADLNMPDRKRPKPLYKDFQSTHDYPAVPQP